MKNKSKFEGTIQSVYDSFDATQLNGTV